MSLDRYLEQFRGRALAADLAVFESVPSTNLLARGMAGARLAAGRRPPALIVMARSQTAGRGRLGRHWASPAGEGVYTSLLLPVDDPDEMASWPLSVPVALCEALVPWAGCRIKWPNDLVVDGRKLGGVLIETLGAPQAVIVGYGLNGRQSEDDLPAAEATSIRLVSGEEPNLPVLAMTLAAAVLEVLQRPAPLTAVLAAYRELSVHRPGDELRCRVGSETVSGRFEGFDERGHLRLRTSGGERRLSGADTVERAEESA